MQTIRFVRKDNQNFSAAIRKNVNDYFREKGISTKGNWKMLIKTVTMFTCYLLPFVFILFVPLSPWLIIPLSLAMGIGMSGVGMGIMHDAVHGSFSNKQWVNKLFGASIYLIGGNTLNWKIQHNVLHHTFTNIDGFDEDIDPKGILRLSPQASLKKIHRFQYIYAPLLYSLMTLSRMVSEFFRLHRYNKAGFTSQQGSKPSTAMLTLALTKAAYLLIFLVLPIIMSPFGFWLVLLGFIITHLTAGFFMSIVFQLAHIVEETEYPIENEPGIINNDWIIHELQTTANFSTNSRWFGWIIGGLNFQVEHHLFPNISHIHYRAISPIVERTAREYGIKYNKNGSFFNAIGSHLRLLKTLGR